MKWFLGIIISAFVSSVISITVVSFFVNKLKLSFDLQNNSIKRIHPKGQAVRSFEKILKSDKCKEIKVLGFSAQGFTHSFRSEITEFIASGGHIQYLLSRPDSLFVRQASEMEGRDENAISESVRASIGIISSISKNARELAEKKHLKGGTIEVRYYDTEIRNQLLMCVDSDDTIFAWMTILLPPKAAVNCQMLEYSDATSCVEYFNTIWDRHKNDTVTF